MRTKRKNKLIQRVEIPEDMYSHFFTIEDHLRHLEKEKWSASDYKVWLRDRFDRKFEYKGLSDKERYWIERRLAKDENQSLFDEGNILNFED